MKKCTVLVPTFFDSHHRQPGDLLVLPDEKADSLIARGLAAAGDLNQEEVEAALKQVISSKAEPKKTTKK